MQVETVADFLNATAEQTKKWRNMEEREFPGEFRPWFRGMASRTWKLAPTLYRRVDSTTDLKKLRHDDHSIFLEFKQRARAFLHELGSAGFEPRDDWDWLFIGRHFGLPTRLLDWTTSVLPSLWFALNPDRDEDKRPENKPCVWMLDPRGVNLLSLGFHDIVAPKSNELHLRGEVDGKTVNLSLPRKVGHWLPGEVGDLNCPSKLSGSSGRTNERAIAIYPASTSLRIQAQKGMFTCHGWSTDPLEVQLQGQDCLVQFEFKNRVPFDELIEQLGLTQEQFYPDLESLARVVAERHR